MKLEAQAEAQARKDIAKHIGKPKHASDPCFDVWSIRLKHVFSKEINPLQIK